MFIDTPQSFLRQLQVGAKPKCLHGLRGVTNSNCPHEYLCEIEAVFENTLTC